MNLFLIGFLICLAAIAAWGVVATMIAVARDGYRPAPTRNLDRQR